VHEEQVAAAIEASLWDMEPEHLRAGVTLIDQPDRLLWAGDVDSPYASKVVRVDFAEEDAGRQVDEIIAWFRRHGRPFSWWVGPSSRPASSPALLEGRGLRLLDRYEGVALRLDGQPSGGGSEPIEPCPGVTVEPVEDEAGVRAMVRVNSRVWGYPVEAEDRLVAERLAYLRLPGRRGGSLLARVDGEVAGTASYRFSGDGQAIYLVGAATLPEFRGRGVFRTLVAWRLRQARARGCRVATCLARENTSAPILRRLGFTRYFMMPVYTGP